MNRRPIMYALVFLLGFLILDRVIHIPLSIGGFFFLGIVFFLLAYASDYWFLALIRDSNVRIGMSGVLNITPIGPSNMRSIGHADAVYDKNRTVAYPPVGVYPRGGLSSRFFLPLQGGGKKGYDIIPDFGLFQDEKGHQVTLLEPYRIKTESIPDIWTEVLQRDKKYRPDSPVYFYIGIPKNIERIVLPSQFVDFQKVDFGSDQAKVSRAEAGMNQLIEENQQMSARLMKAIRIAEMQDKKPSVIEKIKDIVSGEDENGSSRYEKP